MSFNPIYNAFSKKPKAQFWRNQTQTNLAVRLCPFYPMILQSNITSRC